MRSKKIITRSFDSTFLILVVQVLSFQSKSLKLETSHEKLEAARKMLRPQVNFINATLFTLQ